MRIIAYIADNGWMEASFIRGFREAGHEVFLIYYGAGYTIRNFTTDYKQQVKSQSNKLLMLAKEEHVIKTIDLIWFCACDDTIHIDTLISLKKLGIPLVNYQPDMGFLWHRLLKTGHYFDLVACAQTNYIEVYHKKGFQAAFVPFGANRPQYAHQSSSVLYYGVRYLGAPMADRAAYLGHLFRNEVPIEIYGHHWDWYPRKKMENLMNIALKGFRLSLPSPKTLHDIWYYGWPRLQQEQDLVWQKIGVALKKQFTRANQSIDVEAFYAHIPPQYIKGKYYADLFEQLVQSAVINIGFSHMFRQADNKRNPTQMRLRDVEIPMAGGFYLAEYNEDIEACFKDNQHIIYWKTKEELLEKARYFLRNPEEALKIRNAGLHEALAKHTWQHRLEHIGNMLQIQNYQAL